MAQKHRQPPDYITCKHCGKDYRAITVLHLRNIHGYDGEHPIEDYKRRFHLQAAVCREARKKISAAKEDFWARRGQHWTRKSLLTEIRRIYRSGRSLRCNHIPVRLYEAGRRLFGTWAATLEAAGLDYAKATGVWHWTQAKVVEAIRELDRRGVSLSASYIGHRHPALLNAAVKRFPYSWAKELRAAGFDPEAHRMPHSKWSRPKIEDWVRQRAAQGKSLLARDIPAGLLGYVHRSLKIGWADLVEAAGIPYPGIKKRRDWTKAKLLAAIRQRKAQGHRLNYRAVADDCQALIHQARKFFRSWDRTLAAAGV